MNNDETKNLEGYNGAILDDRSEEERQKDVRFGELVASAAPVKWVEKKPEDYRKFPISDQDGSGSCVAQTVAKLMGIMYWLINGVFVQFSATHIYQRRANKPSGGMAAEDVFKIAQDGVTLEVLVPSQKMNDHQMDNVKIDDYKIEVGKVFRAGKRVVLPMKDIEAVASVIQQTQKGAMVWFYFGKGEWDRDPNIKITNLDLYNDKTTSRHSIAAVDYTLYKGKKALVIDDSWGTDAGNGAGQRVIDEDFFKVRNYYAAYFVNFRFEEGTTPVDSDTKPRFTFTKRLQFVAWEDEKNQPVDLVTHETQKADVMKLQDCLRYEGLFPKNVDSTGYFGNLTKEAVENFQRKYNIQVVGEVGPLTRKKLNEIYS